MLSLLQQSIHSAVPKTWDCIFHIVFFDSIKCRMGVASSNTSEKYLSIKILSHQKFWMFLWAQHYYYYRYYLVPIIIVRQGFWPLIVSKGWNKTPFFIPKSAATFLHYIACHLIAICASHLLFKYKMRPFSLYDFPQPPFFQY